MAPNTILTGLKFNMPLVTTHPAPVAHAPTQGLLVTSIFAVGLVFSSGAFNLQLADDASRAFSGSAVMQAISLLTGVIGLSLIVTSRSATKLAIRCWPIIAITGLIFISAAWSHNYPLTIRRGFVFLTTVLLALALVGRFSPLQSLRLIVRVMALQCALSIAWVFAFPEVAVHQITDLGQTQHAGLWRGIFSHKNGLGLFAGLTAGLLLFYGSMAFRSPVGVIAAFSCAIICLIGTSSMTGVLTMVVTAALLYFLYWMATTLDSRVRNQTLYLLLVGIFFGYLLWSAGVLNSLPVWLGRSGDMTGRFSYWAIAMDVFRSSGFTSLGGGYAVGLHHLFPPYVYVDNGYIDILMQFGYLGSTLIALFCVWLLFAGKGVIVRSSRETASLDIFPFAIILALGLENISETNFLAPKHIGIVLTVLAVAIIVQNRRRFAPLVAPSVSVSSPSVLRSRAHR